MKIGRKLNADVFKPYTIEIHIEYPNDASILRNLINKLGPEVKHDGIYYNILRQLDNALKD